MFPFVPRVLMIANIEPGPAIKTAACDMADVIRHQIVAELVALIRAHPKLVRSGTKLDPDCIPDSPGENILAGPVRIEFKNSSAIRFGRVIRHVRKRTDRDGHLLRSEERRGG